VLFLYIKEEYSTRSFPLKGFQNKESFVGVSSRQDYSNFASKYANALRWQNVVHYFMELCRPAKSLSGIIYSTCIFQYLLFECPLSNGNFRTVICTTGKVRAMQATE